MPLPSCLGAGFELIEDHITDVGEKVRHEENFLVLLATLKANLPPPGKSASNDEMLAWLAKLREPLLKPRRDRHLLWPLPRQTAHGGACVTSEDVVAPLLGALDNRLVPLGYEKIRGVLTEIPILEYRVQPPKPGPACQPCRD